MKRRGILLVCAVVLALTQTLPSGAVEPRAPRQPRTPRSTGDATPQARPTGAETPRLRVRAQEAVGTLSGDFAVESRILALINHGRSHDGLDALRPHTGLRSVAREHSERMAARGGITHAGFRSRVNAALSGWTAACENVARFQPRSPVPASTVASTIYRLWLNSPSHRRCMLDESGVGYEIAGVGVVRDTSGGWWATFEAAR